ncbi:MAG: hypothetical protein HY841_04070 [Bacteroidetes bacterium]|nr:hypothetical protein [Bacteroidota bacterium]
MKKYLFLLMLFFISSGWINAQPVAPNTICSENIPFCTDDFIDQISSVTQPCSSSGTLPLWYSFNYVPTSTPGIKVQISGSGASLLSYTLYGPFTSLKNCSLLTNSDIFSSSTTPSQFYNIPVSSNPGFYYISLNANGCDFAINFLQLKGFFICPTTDTIPCEDCIGSFAPFQDSTYLISAWVKEGNAPPIKTSYTIPQLFLEFPLSTPCSPCTTTLGPFTPSGEIIDGWQKVEDKFKIPLNAVKIQIKLDCGSGAGDCFFDDIRVYPFKGSMKSYVYDPVNLRLVAELDERNYATMYEYDEEGKLTRIKKETERGIMTIQETKTSVKKK